MAGAGIITRRSPAFKPILGIGQERDERLERRWKIESAGRPWERIKELLPESRPGRAPAGGICGAETAPDGPWRRAVAFAVVRE